MSLKTPIVWKENNKLGRLGEGELIEGFPEIEDYREVNISLGDATVVTSSGSYDSVFEFDDSNVDSVTVTNLALVAPPTRQVAPTGSTTVQISTDPTYSSNVASISINSAERRKLSSVNIPVDVASGELLYVRFSATGNHNDVSLRVTYKVE